MNFQLTTDLQVDLCKKVLTNTAEVGATTIKSDERFKSLRFKT